jgi:uncharacterized membrane protein
VALIACGVVAFVAAHWDGINKYVKAGMLLAAMLAAHVGGYWLWQVRRPAWPRLGHALVVLGTLIFGANIALFAQIFHISEGWHLGFMALALGATLVGYAAGSVPNLVIGAVASFVWYCGRLEATESAFLVYPLLAAGALLPACYAWRSGTLFFFTILAVAAALTINGAVAVPNAPNASVAFIALTLTALWLLGKAHDCDGRWGSFGVVAGVLAAIGLAAVAYIGSFLDPAKELIAKPHRDGLLLMLRQPDAALVAFSLIGVLLGSALLAGRRRPARLPRALLPCLVGLGMVGAVLLVENAVWMAVAFNAAAVLLAGYGIVAGLVSYRRREYWGGLALIVLLIASRFFEYESHLLVKSAGFVAAGLTLIVAGISFERRLRGQHAPEEADDA